jgi:pseudaminic acid biosynthesis-associated methylase
VSDPAGPRTAQEAFWAGEFGTAYSERNVSDALLASNVHFFSVALRTAGDVTSCLELGANVGMNLKALRQLHPGLVVKAVEINPDAARVLGGEIGVENVRVASVLEYEPQDTFDLVLVKGFLIHINPDSLARVYDTMHRASRRLILVAEYYNPTPVEVPYRGHAGRLFKRDFAGELLDRFPDLTLRDYGFVYRRDPAFPQDDITWFLLEKGA